MITKLSCEHVDRPPDLQALRNVLDPIARNPPSRSSYTHSQLRPLPFYEVSPVCALRVSFRVPGLAICIHHSLPHIALPPSRALLRSHLLQGLAMVDGVHLPEWIRAPIHHRAAQEVW